MEEIHFKVTGRPKDNNTLSFEGKSGGVTLGVTNKYFTKNDQPWFPIMGEYHYSRFAHENWLDELYKMKSGGIEIVSSYVFWIHHEEEKNVWNFENNNNLRKFITLCKEAGLYFWLRIGPWVHAEARNGGFPDWLMREGSQTRSNDPNYLKEVQRYFATIYNECKGLMFDEGGPIIGIQIENEYGHAGGLNGEEGLKHMKELKKLLMDVGFKTPYYSATAWGGGVFIEDETLPMMGGYVDAPWDARLSELPANNNFLISPNMDDSLIASDFSTETSGEFTTNKYPFATAELGGGLQVTKRRRVIVKAADTEALVWTKIASGANLLGYYMYHGGTNPLGKLSTMQESTVTGSHTDVPVLSYDFQAPIGEYGEFNSSYEPLRKIHLFIQSFMAELTESEPVFPTKLITDAEDTTSIRYNVRHNNNTGGGFLFINNYQRHRVMKNHGSVSFTLETDNGKIKTPPITISDGMYGCFPYNLQLDDIVIEKSNANLLCRLFDGTLVFYHDNPDSAEIITTASPSSLLVLSSKEANNALFVNGRLYCTDDESHLWYDENTFRLTTSQEQAVITEYPSKQMTTIHFPKNESSVQHELIETNDVKKYVLNSVFDFSKDVADFILLIDFIGDRAELYDNGKLIADWFNNGETWRVSLSAFSFPECLELRVYPFEEAVYYETTRREDCELVNVSIEVTYLKEIKMDM